METVRPAAIAKGVSLTLATLPSRPVRGDPGRLQQIVWNLLSNAVKYTPHGGSVSVEAGETDGIVQIAVADSGRGIAPEDLARVFDRFWRDESGTRSAVAGLGLGLAIARQLVELHGGTITAESDGVGHGARFVVRLPVDASLRGA
jgi:signal transduction histidine kinase